MPSTTPDTSPSGVALEVLPGGGSEATPEALAASAKGALERVCSGAGLDPIERYYSPSFVDHVNDMEFHGIAGAERSVAMYRRMLDDLSIEVEEQVVAGDRVVSRFVVSGTNRGRPVSVNGITISRFRDGLIVEDWSVTDTLSMLRQLGLVRSLLLVGRSLVPRMRRRKRGKRENKEAGATDQGSPT